MKSYQIQPPIPADDVLERIVRVADALAEQGHQIIAVRLGSVPTISVKPSPATRLLDSVCTGQGWEAGKMYKSYAAVVDSVQVVWHKPMNINNIIRWPGHAYCRAMH